MYRKTNLNVVYNKPLVKELKIPEACCDSLIVEGMQNTEKICPSIRSLSYLLVRHCQASSRNLRKNSLSFRESCEGKMEAGGCREISCSKCNMTLTLNYLQTIQSNYYIIFSEITF